MSWLSLLPSLNAALNATSALCLVAGFVFIRRGAVRAHRAAMLAAVTASSLFLVSYLTYHYHAGSTRFSGQGAARTAYFAILLSHTVLAAAVPPLAGVTLFKALRRNYASHRRIARFTLPIWLYVSATGVLVYLFLYHLYPVAAQPD